MDPAGGGEMGTVLETYICSMCGITSETHHQWGPICKKTGSRVCDRCCFECEHHVGWSGIWSCNYISQSDKKEAAMKRARDRFNEENKRISSAYMKRRKEEARKRAIKSAVMRKKTG